MDKLPHSDDGQRERLIAQSLLEDGPTQVATREKSSPALEALRSVQDAIGLEDVLSLEDQLTSLHPADQADLFELLGRDEREALVGYIGPLIDPQTLTYLEGDLREQLLETLDDATVAIALNELEVDDAVDILEDLDEDDARAILDRIPAADRALIEGGLEFPEESAGRLMAQGFVALPDSWTVGQAIDYMRAAKDLPADFYDLYVVTEGLKPVGVMPLSRLLRSKRPVKLADLMAVDIHPLSPNLDQEDLAYEFRQYGLVSAPIVEDRTGRMLGVVTVDDVLHVMEEEAQDDILKLAGVSSEGGGSGFFDGPLSITRSRLPWLMINLGTAVLASVVIGLFGAQLEKIVALAILMPIVASMGGNAGTQTLTVAIRALAMKDISRATVRRFLVKEAAVGMINGSVFAATAAVVTVIWFKDPLLAGVIAVAMILNMFVAALGGAAIPLLLDRCGVDPANASGVFLTTLTDVVGFIAFLGLASLVLF